MKKYRIYKKTILFLTEYFKSIIYKSFHTLAGTPYKQAIPTFGALKAKVQANNAGV